jgi:hypothetical protein
MKHADTRQIHVRVTPDLKKAVKMFCVRNGTTEQSWVRRLVENELHRKAPDLWAPDSDQPTPSTKAKRH